MSALLLDWADNLIKLDQLNRKLKDDLNDENYQDAEEALFGILNYAGELLVYVGDKIEKTTKEE